ncbi:acylphosphatase [Chelativorans sp. YIM 93263]|uniref:acylphosphatase n=1 Tax=Chelativorans sp. YIM 93263 TaxID=2906648 RepID=UPI0023780101|nr:acylphosphatase [Chelativorans sp. YIM 93263]
MSEDRIAMRARISGRVQGVNYRAWTQGEAEKLGLAGWVRNEADGSVTAVLAGEDESVSLMLDKLRQGPPAASVRDVESEEFDPEVWPTAFTVER